MVCQEEVFSWFKELSGYKRLDVMCGLLNVCLPFELRFVGTCVEDLGKKDFHYLRDAENRANNTTELAKLTNLKDDVTRSKLIVSLALLESSNHVCSNVIFNILTGEDGKWIQLSRPEDEKVMEEVLLLFTMALYHPAFTFEQKSAVGNQLNDFRKWSKDLSAKDDQSNKLNESAVTTLESLNCKLTTIWPHVCPAAAEWSGTWISHVELKRCQRRKAEKKIDFRIQVTWTNCEATEVIKTYQELYEFSQLIMQLCSEESRLHLNDSTIFQLPALKMGNKNFESTEDIVTRVSEFLCSVSKLLPQLAGCEGVLSFFQRPLHQTSWSAPSISPTHSSSSQGLMLGSVQCSTQQATNAQNLRLPKDDLVAETNRMKSLTIYNSQMGQSSKDNRSKLQSNPATGTPRDNNNTKISRYNTPLYPTPCSTPVTSPHSSPTPSPFVSPSQSIASSRATSPWIQRSDVAAQTVAMKQISMKQERMKKCKPKPNNLTLDESQAFTDEELPKDSLSLEAIGQIRKTLRNCPMNGLNLRNGEEVKMSSVMSVSAAATVGIPSPPNAQDMHTALVYISPADSQNHSLPRVVPSRPSQILPMVSTNTLPNTMLNVGSVALPCAFFLQQMPQPRPMPPQFSSTPQQSQQQQMASTESSPSCSEYSSPPGSPSLEMRNNCDSSCSEETERDKDPSSKSRENKSRPASTFGCKMNPSSDCANARNNLHAKSCGEEDQVAVSLAETTAVNTSCPMNNSSNALPLRPVVMPDIVPVSSSVPGASVGPNSSGLPRSRFNSTPCVSPSIGLCFNSSSQQQLTVASPVKSSNTIIFENSHLMKSLPTAVVSPTPPNMQARWDGNGNIGAGGCASATTTIVTVHSQNVSSYMTTTTTAPPQMPQQDVSSYRTSNTVVPSTSTSGSCQSQRSVVAGNGSSSHRHGKNAYPQNSEEIHKLNNIAGLPCVGQASESLHPVPSYPTTPNTYPSMPPSPGAVTAPPVATSTTPIFLSANNYPLSNNQGGSSSNTQGQMNAQGILPPTVCVSSCPCSCNQTNHGTNLPYSTNFLTFPVNNAAAAAAAAMYHSFPPYMQAHNANNFIPATLPPNFHFTGNPMATAAPPPPIPNGISPELYSSNQFPVMPQNASQQSTRVAMPGFMASSNVPFHNSYGNPSNQHVPSKPKSMSCYNCGIVGHRGLECKESTMEEITKPGQFRLNYAPTTRQTDGPE